MIAQECECSECHRTVCFNGQNLNFVLSIFYHKILISALQTCMVSFNSCLKADSTFR